MGIKNLTKFLRTRYPQLFKIVKLSNFKNMKIAIDISIYICRFKISHGKRWLDAFIKMIICLRKNNINCLFVYDGGFPVEKNIEHAKRKISRQRNIERINILENDLREYINSGIVTNNLEKVMYFYNQNLNTSVASQTLLRRPILRSSETSRSDGADTDRFGGVNRRANGLYDVDFGQQSSRPSGGPRIGPQLCCGPLCGPLLCSGGDLSEVDFVSRGSSEDDASVEGDREAAAASGGDLETTSTKGGDLGEATEGYKIINEEWYSKVEGGDREAAACEGGDREAASTFGSDQYRFGQRPTVDHFVARCSAVDREAAMGDSIKINIEVIQNKIEKMKRYIFSITQVDYDITKNMFDIFSIPWIIAPMEAETLCSDLCIQKKIDAVLSEDSDVFAYGNPITILNINIFDDTCTYINYDELLNTVDMLDGSFLDFCILCGSDYNSNIPKIGIEKSFNFIKKYKTLENIKDNINIDIFFLKFKEVRSIFRNYTKSTIDIPFCSNPNYDKLKTFIETNEISTNIEYIKFFLRNK